MTLMEKLENYIWTQTNYAKHIARLLNLMFLGQSKWLL